MSLYINTIAEIKADLGIGDTTDDAVLTRWLEGLQGRIASHCGRAFLEESGRVEIFDGGYTSLLVHAWPIESVSGIVIAADQDWTDADSALDSDDYLVNYRRGAILYGRGTSRWPGGRQLIRVTYTGGLVAADGTAASSYVETRHLQALKRAFMMQGEFEWRQRTTLGLSQISMAGASIQQGPQVTLALKGTTLVPEVQTTLHPLMRII